MDLIGQVMNAEPYASAPRVFVIVDNGSDHRGQAAITRLAKAHPNAIMIHTPVHASWLNQIEIFFSITQKKVISPNDFASLDELRQARRDWAGNQQLRETYRQHRPMVERSIAWLIGPKSRCRQLRYRGVAKGNQWLHLRMAGLNLRRMINLGLQPKAGGGWVIPDPA
jgi:transposase